ncbi:MAG: 3-hydroxyacyl-ACP dehydratase [Bacteroidota bacterium]
MMLATRNDITRFIPQREPMVMIHTLVEASDKHAVTQMLVEPENIFVSGEVLGEPGLVENIAQTAAAQVGYQCALKNIPVPVGYIAAVKDLRFHALPKMNSTITTTIKITNQVLNITLAEGSIEQDGKEFCSCEMRIFVKTES